jgi:hypothetical protein
MRMPFVRHRIVWFIAPVLVVALIGLTVALVMHNASGPARASGQYDIDILNGGADLNACTPTFGCTPQVETNVCQPKTADGTVNCTFTLDRHSGGVLREDGVTPCRYFVTIDSYLGTFDSHVKYLPNGKVTISCVFPPQG